MHQNRNVYRPFFAIPASIPAVVWYYLIWVFSNQTSNQSEILSNGLLYRFLETASPAFASESRFVQIAVIEFLSFFERKAAHMFLYFMLALLLSFTMYFFMWRIRHKIALVVFLCTILAWMDEYHQTMIPGRSGEIRDVCVDLCGVGIALCFSLLPYLAEVWRKRPVITLLVSISTIVCFFPIFFAIAGARTLADSPLFAWLIMRFFPESEGVPLSILPSLLSPIVWDLLYLVTCGIMGVCAMLSMLLSKIELRKTISLSVIIIVATALFATRGTAHSLVAACLTLLGMVGMRALWMLGEIFYSYRQS